MTIGHRRAPWKRRALMATLLAAAGPGVRVVAVAVDTPPPDRLPIERADPSRRSGRDDAATSGRAAPPKFDLERLAVRVVDLDTDAGPEPVLEIQVDTVPWSGEVEPGSRIEVFLALDAGPPLELALHYQEPRSVRRSPEGGAARFAGPGQLAALSAVSPGRGARFRLPLADLPGAQGNEPVREARVWVLAVQGGSQDRLPDTDDGGPPDTEEEVVRVRLPARGAAGRGD